MLAGMAPGGARGHCRDSLLCLGSSSATRMMESREVASVSFTTGCLSDEGMIPESWKVQLR